jgi:hypothetical protein
MLPVKCQFDEFTFDIRENRLLLEAVSCVIDIIDACIVLV